MCERGVKHNDRDVGCNESNQPAYYLCHDCLSACHALNDKIALLQSILIFDPSLRFPDLLSFQHQGAAAEAAQIDFSFADLLIMSCH